IGSIEYVYDNKSLAQSDLKISNISYISAPYAADQPSKPSLTFPLSAFLILLSIGIAFAIVFILLIKRKRKKRFKHKKLRFSKTLK
ncbi:MAG: hypothetical protein RR582_11515, partial [Niameybacter sp.]